MPTGRNGRLWALILMLIAVASVYLVVVVPLVNLYAERQSVLQNRRMLLPRLGAAAEELPGLRARASELRAAVGAQKVPLEGTSDGIASANLQSRIEELAASAGATISSTESLPAEVRGGYCRIGLRYCAHRLGEAACKTRGGDIAACNRQPPHSGRTARRAEVGPSGNTRAGDTIAQCRARRLRLPRQRKSGRR